MHRRQQTCRSLQVAVTLVSAVGFLMASPIHTSMTMTDAWTDLRDVTSLTFEGNWVTLGNFPEPQLQCTGPYCLPGLMPLLVECVNTGFGRSNVQWDCSPSFPPGYGMSKPKVVCEDHPDRSSSLVVSGSCLLKYELSVTGPPSNTSMASYMWVAVVLVIYCVCRLFGFARRIRGAKTRIGTDFDSQPGLEENGGKIGEKGADARDSTAVLGASREVEFDAHGVLDADHPEEDEEAEAQGQDTNPTLQPSQNQLRHRSTIASLVQPSATARLLVPPCSVGSAAAEVTRGWSLFSNPLVCYPPGAGVASRDAAPPPYVSSHTIPLRPSEIVTRQRELQRAGGFRRHSKPDSTTESSTCIVQSISSASRVTGITI